MKRPGMAAVLAGMAALAAPMAGSVSTPNGYSQAQVKSGGGMTTPQGGIGSLLGAMFDGNTSAGAGFAKPRYTNRKGWSCAEAKRRKVRGRNKLRAKGQHRKAVR